MPRSFAPPKYNRQKNPRGNDRAFVNLDGKRIYLGKYGSEESKAKFAELVGGAHASATLDDKGGDTSTPLRSNPTVNEMLIAYLKYAQTYYGQTDSKEYSAYIGGARFLRRDAGKELAADYGPLRLRQLREAMIDEPNFARQSVAKPGCIDVSITLTEPRIPADRVTIFATNRLADCA